jgi:hypothetical protein
MPVNYDSGFYGYDQATVTFDGTDTSSAKTRFVLDDSMLNDFNVGLDGSSPGFTLDTSTLDGLGKLDGYTFLTVATGSSSLGGISASASAQATIFPVLSSSLGGLDALASAQSTLFPVLSSSLGGLDATASASAIIFPVLDAPLDGLVATATAQSTPPEPPPVDDGVGYQQPYRQKPLRKQVKPVEIPIQIEVIPEPVIIVAQGMSRLGGIDCLALGSITFSTLDDDAEVLLLV